MTTKHPTSFDDQFLSLWRELYDPENRKSPIAIAVRKVLRYRPIYIPGRHFHDAVLGRVFQKVQTDVRKKSFDRWHASIQYLPAWLERVARSAASEELYAIVPGIRWKQRPILCDLEEADSAVKVNFVALMERRCLHNVVQFYIDMGAPDWYSIADHIRRCPECSDLFARIGTCFKEIDSRPLNSNPDLIRLIDALELRDGTILFLRSRRRSLRILIKSCERPFKGRTPEEQIPEKRRFEADLKLVTSNLRFLSSPHWRKL